MTKCAMHTRREGRFYRVTFTDGVTVVAPYCERCRTAAARDAARAIKHPALGVAAITAVASPPRPTSRLGKRSSTLDEEFAEKSPL